MLNAGQKKAQAATELAVFGAILIFILGTIVRTVLNNGYTQNSQFKAMRQALLNSWIYSTKFPGQNIADTSHNSDQVLVVEDRLSPDFNKYGALDRVPFISAASGTLSYVLFYPLTSAWDITNSIPVMDVYINGQQFPFQMAAFIQGRQLVKTSAADCTAPDHSCRQDQCLRYYREWRWGSGVNIMEKLFDQNNVGVPEVAPLTPMGACVTQYAQASDQRKCQATNNACTIFTDLASSQVFSSTNPSGSLCVPDTVGVLNLDMTTMTSVNESAEWKQFMSVYQVAFPGLSAHQYTIYFKNILNILQGGNREYKLFYQMVANPGVASFGITTAPDCSNPPSINNELCRDFPLMSYGGQATTDGLGAPTNVNAVMQYDLARNADYTIATGVLSPSQFPLNGCPQCMRSYIAWKWAATAATSAAMIGLNTSNNVFPQYDIDGRLKTVTIYNLSYDPGSGTTTVSYVDPDGGDIDANWDNNSCGPKPGLQPNAQVFTFTKSGTNATAGGAGTYLLIQEGKLYNPETGQVVRSVNKRDTIDLIQRTIQLSNNTGRFCLKNTANTRCDGSEGITCAAPNSVEACVDGITVNCFSRSDLLVRTCYDTSQNKIFVRSRVEDRRGRAWITDASGQLKVQL